MSSDPDFLPFTRPAIDEATIAEVAAVLRSGWITTGPKCRDFEAALSQRFGGRPVRLASSATAALELALRQEEEGVARQFDPEWQADPARTAERWYWLGEVARRRGDVVAARLRFERAASVPLVPFSRKARAALAELAGAGAGAEAMAGAVPGSLPGSLPEPLALPVVPAGAGAASGDSAPKR